MKKGYSPIDSDYYLRLSILANEGVKLQREGKEYKGIVKREGARFYLVYSNKRIRIKPGDDVIRLGKLEKRIK